MKKDNSPLVNILILMKPYKKEVFLIIISSIFTIFLSAISPILNKSLIDEGLLIGNRTQVITNSLFIFVIAIFLELVKYVQLILSTNMNNKITYKLYYKAFKKILRIKVSKLNESNYNQLVRQFELDISNITKITDGYLINSLMSGIKILGGLIGLLFISWKLSFILMAFIPLKIIINNYFAKQREENVRRWLDIENKFNFWLGNVLAGIMEIKLWSLYKVKQRELKEHQKNIYKTKFKFVNIIYLNSIVDIILEKGLANFLVFIIGASMVFNNKLTVGSLFSFITYSSFILSPIYMLLNMKLEFAQVKPSIDRYLEFIDSDMEKVEPISYEDNHLLKNGIYSIEYKSVNFKINNKDILKNINLRVNKGEKIAFIGHNGSGKTSLINLLLQFYKPTDGEILINGKNIYKMNLDFYRSNFSVMSQKSYLFNDSVLNNIIMTEKPDKEKVDNIINSIGATEFIDKLHEGYDTVVGNDGSKLSGGEKQKIAMARTLYKNGNVLIFDEASSNFDLESEKRFFDIIKNSKNFDIVIVISHRESILKAVDKILLMEHGQIKVFDNYSNIRDEILQLY